MNVFIAWSGATSKAYAEHLRRWLGTVIQAAKPWMSEVDINAGERWSGSLAKKLKSTNFGVLCVTRENVCKPWLLFEAGALAKALDSSRVVPLLIEMTKGELDELHSPLAQFQAVETKKAGILFLVKSINLALETEQLSEGDLAMAFRRGWPVLSKQLNAVPHPPTQHRDLKSIVQAFDIMNERRDFTIMVRYFEDAQDAHICSGDYSWIKDNNDIQGKILELAAKKSIVLESYKTEKEIRDKLGDDLFEKLRMSLRFQNGRKIKCSLIRHSGSEVFLYRSTRVEDEKQIDRICVLTDGGEGRSLIDTLSTLISSKKRSVANHRVIEQAYSVCVPSSADLLDPSSCSPTPFVF